MMIWGSLEKERRNTNVDVGDGEKIFNDEGQVFVYESGRLYLVSLVAMVTIQSTTR